MFELELHLTVTHPPGSSWELNLGPPQEEQALLATKPISQPQKPNKN